MVCVVCVLVIAARAVQSFRNSLFLRAAWWQATGNPPLAGSHCACEASPLIAENDFVGSTSIRLVLFVYAIHWMDRFSVLPSSLPHQLWVSRSVVAGILTDLWTTVDTPQTPARMVSVNLTF